MRGKNIFFSSVQIKTENQIINFVLSNIEKSENLVSNS